MIFRRNFRAAKKTHILMPGSTRRNLNLHKTHRSLPAFTAHFFDLYRQEHATSDVEGNGRFDRLTAAALGPASRTRPITKILPVGVTWRAQRLPSFELPNAIQDLCCRP